MVGRRRPTDWTTDGRWKSGAGAADIACDCRCPGATRSRCGKYRGSHGEMHPAGTDWPCRRISGGRGELIGCARPFTKTRGGDIQIHGRRRPRETFGKLARRDGTGRVPDRSRDCRGDRGGRGGRGGIPRQTGWRSRRRDAIDAEQEASGQRRERRAAGRRKRRHGNCIAGHYAAMRVRHVFERRRIAQQN